VLEADAQRWKASKRGSVRKSPPARSILQNHTSRFEAFSHRNASAIYRRSSHVQNLVGVRVVLLHHQQLFDLLVCARCIAQRYPEQSPLNSQHTLNRSRALGLSTIRYQIARALIQSFMCVSAGRPAIVVCSLIASSISRSILHSSVLYRVIATRSQQLQQS
jgi:hypothetical protein